MSADNWRSWTHSEFISVQDDSADQVTLPTRCTSQTYDSYDRRTSSRQVCTIMRGIAARASLAGTIRGKTCVRSGVYGLTLSSHLLPGTNGDQA